MKTQSVVMLLAGMVLGCGAATTVAVSWAGPSAGKWQCYGARELPDMTEASNEGDAQKFTSGLNLASPNSPVGSTIMMSGTGDGFNYLCAKN
jgi:hypothetical protein